MTSSFFHQFKGRFMGHVCSSAPLSINFCVGLICLFGSSPPAAIREGAVALGATLYVLFPALPMVCREPDIGTALDVLIPTFWVAPGPCLSRFVVRCSVPSSFAEVYRGIVSSSSPLLTMHFGLPLVSSRPLRIGGFPVTDHYLPIRI